MLGELPEHATSEMAMVSRLLRDTVLKVAVPENSVPEATGGATPMDTDSDGAAADKAAAEAAVTVCCEASMQLLRCVCCAFVHDFIGAGLPSLSGGDVGHGMPKIVGHGL